MIMRFLTLIYFCLGHASVILSNADLKNVAYAKSVTLSSEFNTDRTFPGSKAVNGFLSDFAHTATEKYPWLRIDLGANYQVHEIEVFARSDCCDYQLHDLDVRVGHSIHNLRLCGHFTGHTTVGGRIPVWCPQNVTGRYVQIQIVAGTSNVLSPAEVLVWGVHVN